MENKNSKRCKIRKISFLLAAFLVVGIFAISGNLCAYQSKQKLNNISQRALCNLDDALSNIEVNLEKGIYSNSLPMLSKLAMQLSKETSGAKNSLSTLPISSAELQNTYVFLSQVGDFVSSLQTKLDMGLPLTPKEQKELCMLLEYAKTLSGEMATLRQKLFAGEILFESAQKTLSVQKVPQDTLHSSLEDTKDAFTDYKSLIYDGPFSDHMLNRSSKFLKDMPTVSKDEAQIKAAKILNVPTYSLEFKADEEDSAEAYRFYDGVTSIAMTKQGSYLSYMLSSKNVGEEKISPTEAQKYASDFLKANGFHNMQEVYYVVDDGICTFSYAYQDGEYICYPDLIKISVSLENGEILSCDCRNYLLSHHKRQFLEPRISMDTAKKSLNPLLKVLGSKLAVIPTASGKEREVFEMHCKNEEGQEFLIYLNTQTGFEEDILLLFYEDNGVLTK